MFSSLVGVKSFSKRKQYRVKLEVSPVVCRPITKNICETVSIKLTNKSVKCKFHYINLIINRTKFTKDKEHKEETGTIKEEKEKTKINF